MVKVERSVAIARSSDGVFAFGRPPMPSSLDAPPEFALVR